ncbi:hypothetical protein POM88_021983 [Heracleum sosnowskyi]|uniref:Uncharacterized protein n=1 Tax=Heracleum sosnowskyi TaxID=360622 RepID=A0AAD8IFM5_9APIA|nr:hypothetical protein POM88_021983 [Heracleum sosnowskyi]
MIPFAKLFVRYKLGAPLPSTLNVMALDPQSNELINAEVLVTYPNKPHFCEYCNSLGQPSVACPNVSKSWVHKSSEGTPCNVDSKGGNLNSPLDSPTLLPEANSSCQVSAPVLATCAPSDAIEGFWA